MKARTNRSIRSFAEKTVTARQSRSTGGVTVTGVEVNPNRVLPNGTVTVTVHLKETVEFVAGGNVCQPEGFLNASGIRTDVNVRTSWGASDYKQVCVPMWILSNGEKEVQFRFQAPNIQSEEQHSIEVEAQVGNNDKALITKSVIVTGTDGGGSAGCQTDADCPSGTVCQGGECVPEDSGPGGNDGNIVEDATNLIMVGAGAYVLFKIGESVTD